MKTYSVNEIFFSLQGEGVRVGSANIFVRFAGCNLTCKIESHGFDCDTEFTSSRKLTAVEITNEMEKIAGTCRSVILTGGEPMLQVDEELLHQLHHQGWYIAMETNGSLPVHGLVDWVTVSPKVAEHAIRQLTANEVKYVRSVGQAIPKTFIEAEYQFISPAWGSDIQKNLAHCIQLVKENPKWRLSLQQHKLWAIR